MRIKILGSGCANCQRLERLVREAAQDLGVPAEIEKVTDYPSINWGSSRWFRPAHFFFPKTLDCRFG